MDPSHEVKESELTALEVKYLRHTVVFCLIEFCCSWRFTYLVKMAMQKD